MNPQIERSEDASLAGPKQPIGSNRNFFIKSNHICDVLHDWVPFVQFKKREKQQWWSVTFSRVAG